MKLFVIVRDNDNNVIAVSEEESDIALYFKQKKFKESDYTIHTLTNDNMCKTVMTHYDDLYVETTLDSNLCLTRVERELVEGIEGQEKGRISDTLDDLSHYIQNYSLTKSQKKVLKEARKTLKKLECKNFEKTVKIDVFIESISKGKYTIESIRNRLNDTVEKMLVFIRN